MPKPEQVTISMIYFMALVELRQAADLFCAATEGTDEYAQAEEGLEAALGHLLLLDEGGNASQPPG